MAEIDRLRGLHGIKWAKYGSEVLPAWVADMDFDQAPAIKRVIIEMVERGDLGYYPMGLEPLTHAWLDWVERRDGWRPPFDEVWQFTGALHALEAIMVMQTQPGDGVVLFTPIYEPFRAAIEESGRRVVDVPLDEGTWRLDADRFDDIIDAGTRVVLFCQPHNPLGRVFDTGELQAFADVVERRDLLVISDEIWADLTHEPHRHLPLVQADPRLAEHTVTVGSASKAFNIAGLRCALAHIGPPHIRRALKQFPYHLLGGPSTVSAMATIAAWNESDGWLADTKRTLRANRDHLASRLAAEAPHVGLTVPEATYLAWLDFRAADLGDNPSKTMLKRWGVALEPGYKFGHQGAGHARLNFATPAEVLDPIIDRLIAAATA